MFLSIWITSSCFGLKVDLRFWRGSMDGTSKMSKTNGLWSKIQKVDPYSGYFGGPGGSKYDLRIGTSGDAKA